jgi:hypothetical protein
MNLADTFLWDAGGISLRASSGDLAMMKTSQDYSG